MAKAKVGDSYTYKGEESIGRGNEGLSPGTSVTVRDIVPASMKGAHNDSEDAVVVVWEAATLVRTGSGNEVGFVDRAISISTARFESDFVKEA